MLAPIVGLHHVTAIASDPQQNLDFYTQVLGLRFVKRTVNFDDPEHTTSTSATTRARRGQSSLSFHGLTPQEEPPDSAR